MGDERGLAMVTVLLLLSLLMAFIAVHFVLTAVEMATTKSSMNSAVGFYAAEAGLNIRAQVVRDQFKGFARPGGASPDSSGKVEPCETGNEGSGDFRCMGYQFRERDVETYVEEAPDSDTAIVIPRGEPFQDCHAREYHYVVFSHATNPSGALEAVLEVHLKSRVVPLFQFAAFHDKDLEVITLDDLVLNGPVHTNGDLYLGTTAHLDLTRPITVAGDLYRGRKDADTCLAGPVRVNDPENPVEIPTCSTGRRQILQSEVSAWEGMINEEVSPLTLPAVEEIDAAPGRFSWDNADLRIMLDLNGPTPVIEVRRQDGTVKVGATSQLTSCGVASHSDQFFNNREGVAIDMLDIDVRGMMDCLFGSGTFFGVNLDDVTNGGLVWYLGVDGPDSGGINGYGVRVSNAADLASTLAAAPLPLGLTIVTDQALYVQGDFNALNKKPAALIADSMNVLSNAWNDANSSSPLASRSASTTTVNAAVMAGTDSTGGAEGAAGQDSGGFNGGLLNLIRLHEDWSGTTFTFRGSLISLNVPRHVDGAWSYGGMQYTDPVRDWSFDTDFEDSALIPPLSPRFVYLKQELFVRQFEL